MATIGYDCEVILDGVGYFVRPGSYAIHRPRVRRAQLRNDGGESYIDLGPGKRQWSMSILCMNDLQNYDGSTNSNDGEAFRLALLASYNKVGQTVVFTDPTNTAITVHFDDYAERMVDLHAQIIAPASGGPAPRGSYDVQIVLVEA